MSSLIKWLFFFLAIYLTRSPVAAILVLVAFYLIQMSSEKEEEQGSDYESTKRPYRKVSNSDENADIGLIYLAAYVMQIENEVHPNQVLFIQRFLARNFDEEHVLQRLNLLDKLLSMRISYEDGCRRVIYYYELEHRYKIIDFLFSVAASDGRVSYNEMLAIRKIAQALYVDINDFEKLKRIYFKESEQQQRNREQREQAYYASSTTSSIEIHYQKLGIKPSATVEELKASYRKQVLIYHPDKWLSASKAEQEKAKTKFIEIQNAYDKIREYRGIK